STSLPYIASDRSAVRRPGPAAAPSRRSGRLVAGETDVPAARTLACMSPVARTATLTVRRSTRFVTWVRAWRAGLIPYDDVADEIAEGEEHLAAACGGAPTVGPGASG